MKGAGHGPPDRQRWVLAWLLVLGVVLLGVLLWIWAGPGAAERVPEGALQASPAPPRAVAHNAPPPPLGVAREEAAGHGALDSVDPGEAGGSVEDALVLRLMETVYGERPAPETAPDAVQYEHLGERPAAGATVCWVAFDDALAAMAEDPHLAAAWGTLMNRECYHLLVDPESSPLPPAALGAGTTDSRGRLSLPNTRGNLLIVAQKGNQIDWEIAVIDPWMRSFEMTMELGGILRLQVVDATGTPLAGVPLSIEADLSVYSPGDTVTDKLGRAEMLCQWVNSADTANFLAGFGLPVERAVGVKDLNGPPVVIRLPQPMPGIVRVEVQGRDGRPLPGQHPVALQFEPTHSVHSFDTERPPDSCADGMLEWRNLPLETPLTLSMHAGEWETRQVDVPPLTSHSPFWSIMLHYPGGRQLMAMQVLDPVGRPVAHARFLLDGPADNAAVWWGEELLSDDNGVVLLDALGFVPGTPAPQRYLDLTLSTGEGIHLENGRMTARVFPPPASGPFTWCPPARLQPHVLLGSGQVISRTRGGLDLTLMESPDQYPESVQVELDWNGMGCAFRILGPPAVRTWWLELADPKLGTSTHGPYRGITHGIELQRKE